jgi:hypothetical protein
MGFLAILGLLLGWNLKLDKGSILERKGRFKRKNFVTNPYPKIYP